MSLDVFEGLTPSPTTPSTDAYSHCIAHTCLTSAQVIIFLVYDVVIVVVSLTCNVLVVASVVQTPELRTQSNALVSSLAVVDILIACVCIPIDIAIGLGVAPDVAPMTCLALSSLIGTTIFLTIFHITAIAFDRYLVITSPYTYHDTMTPSRLVSLIVFIWMLSLACSAIPFGWNNLSRLGKNSSTNTPCDLLFVQIRGYRVMIVLIAIVVPFSLISYWYYHIYRVARRHRRRIDALERVLESSVLSREKRSSRAFKRELKAATTLILLLGGFVVGLSPASFMCFIDVFIPGVRLDDVYIYELLCFKISFSTSFVNPLIYAARNSDLRAALLRQVSMIFPCRSLSRRRDADRTSRNKTNPAQIGEESVPTSGTVLAVVDA